MGKPAVRQPMPDLLVVVPGIMGSILTDAEGRELWTIRARKLLPMIARMVTNRASLELGSDVGEGRSNDGIEPTELMTDLHAIPGVWTINGYGRLVDWLKLRFEVNETWETGQPGNLVLFPYDWRLSNRHSGRRLADTIDERLASWRKTSKNSQAQVTLICHSMGGLVARWFLDVEGGDSVCRRLITMGTPFQGAPKAIAALANGVHKGLGPLKADLTAMVRSFPSVRELMATYPCVDSGNGILASIDETEVPNLDASCIAWGRQFHADLYDAAPASGQATYQTVALKGHLQPTDQVAQITDSGVKLDDLEDYGSAGTPYRRRVAGRPDPEPVPNARGDGTVARGSSHPKHWANEADIPASDKVQGFVPKHADLQNSQQLQESLYQILTADRLGQTAGGDQVAVSAPEMVELGEPVTIRVRGAESKVDYLLLEVRVDGNEKPAAYFEHKGGGLLEAEVPDLSADVHELTVTATEGAIPIQDVTTLITIADDAYLEKVVNRELDADDGTER